MQPSDVFRNSGSCIFRTCDIVATPWPSLKTVVLSCVSNQEEQLHSCYVYGNNNESIMGRFFIINILPCGHCYTQIVSLHAHLVVSFRHDLMQDIFCSAVSSMSPSLPTTDSTSLRAFSCASGCLAKWQRAKAAVFAVYRHSGVGKDDRRIVILRLSVLKIQFPSLGCGMK